MARRLTIWGGIGGYNGVFPTEGNREMVCDFLDRCAEAGVSRFIPGYTPGREMCLRFDHGRGGHDPADILAVVPGFYSVHGWDPLSFLVEEAHVRGIEVHPYNAVGYTGMTGIDYQSGTRLPEWRLARFANDHPELWMRRQDGMTCFDVSGSVVLSYGTRVARLHEQQPFLEMARNYDVDGVQLEFQIESVPGQVDGHGVMVYGYEKAIVEDYRRETGRDAMVISNQDRDWTLFRARYVTRFVRELRRHLSALERKVSLTAAVAPNPEAAWKRFQNWPEWVEEGLVDEIHIRHLTGNQGHIFEDTRAAARAVAGRVPLVAQLVCWGPPKLVTPELLRQGADAALAAGADDVGVYRADSIERLNLWGAVRTLACSGDGGDKPA